jgi:hypothetical protein
MIAPRALEIRADNLFIHVKVWLIEKQRRVLRWAKISPSSPSADRGAFDFVCHPYALFWVDE